VRECSTVCRYGFDPCHVAPERNVDDSLTTIPGRRRNDGRSGKSNRPGYSASTSARRSTRIVGDKA
jgi:hypothetical protein